jgi:transposase
MVARHYDVNANQIFSWRKRYRDDPREPAGGSAPQLIPVTVTAETTAVATAPSTVTETIEIDLAHGGFCFDELGGRQKRGQDHRL